MIMTTTGITRKSWNRNGKVTSKVCRVSIFLLLLSFIFLDTVYAVRPLDTEISLSIQNKFNQDEIISVENIDVLTRNGVVILTGNVRNMIEKDRTAQIAESVKGVREINNLITVKPLARPDEKIKEGVITALLINPAIEASEIYVQAINGVVRLIGTVESWAEKDRCAQVAKSIKGVKEVHNQIVIQYAEERPDTEILAEVENRLKYDATVQDDWIDVTVQDGVVTLSGRIGSLSEKNRAIHSAWISGVREVNAGSLEVDWILYNGQDQQYAWERTRSSISNDEIQQAIRDSFLDDPLLRMYNPEIAIENGIVTLTGSVGNLQAKEEAEQVARNVQGVRQVNNFLEVQSQRERTSLEMANDIRELLINDSYVDAYKVSVTVINGVVYLDGNADREFVKDRAKSISMGVEGVADVVNRITVS